MQNNYTSYFWDITNLYILYTLTIILKFRVLRIKRVHWGHLMKNLLYEFL